MGWTFGNKSKKELVAELTAETDKRKLVAKRVVGNHLWCVWEYCGENLISLCLLERYQGDWGYKDFSEVSHPFYYDCPERFFELVPDDSVHACGAWREQVRQYHREKANERAIKVGVRVRVKEGWGAYSGSIQEVIRILPRKKACVVIGSYRFPRRALEVVL